MKSENCRGRRPRRPARWKGENAEGRVKSEERKVKSEEIPQTHHYAARKMVLKRSKTQFADFKKNGNKWLKIYRNLESKLKLAKKCRNTAFFRVKGQIFCIF